MHHILYIISSEGTFLFLCCVLPLAFLQLLQEGLHTSAAWTSPLHHYHHLCCHGDLEV